MHIHAGGLGKCPTAQAAQKHNGRLSISTVNGEPFYGTPELMKAAGAQNDEAIDVGGLQRRIVLIYPGIQDADMGWKEVVDDLRLAQPHRRRWIKTRMRVQKRTRPKQSGQASA